MTLFNVHIDEFNMPNGICIAFNVVSAKVTSTWHDIFFDNIQNATKWAILVVEEKYTSHGTLGGGGGGGDCPAVLSQDDPATATGNAGRRAMKMATSPRHWTLIGATRRRFSTAWTWPMHSQLLHSASSSRDVETMTTLPPLPPPPLYITQQLPALLHPSPLLLYEATGGERPVAAQPLVTPS